MCVYFQIGKRNRWTVLYRITTPHYYYKRFPQLLQRRVPQHRFMLLWQVFLILKTQSLFSILKVEMRIHPTSSVKALLKFKLSIRIARHWCQMGRSEFFKSSWPNGVLMLNHLQCLQNSPAEGKCQVVLLEISDVRAVLHDWRATVTQMNTC